MFSHFPLSGNKVLVNISSTVCRFQLVTLYCSWFDTFNSRRRYHKSKNAACAYGGEYTELQNKILKDFSDAIKNLLCDGHDKMIDFQHGIVVTSAALPELYNELYLEYQVGIHQNCCNCKISFQTLIPIIWRLFYIFCERLFPSIR